MSSIGYNTMGNIEFFNELAEKKIFSNARMFSFDRNVYKRTFADIARKVNFLKSDVVLDLGGGCGQIANFIAAECKQVALADGAESSIRAAKQLLANRQNIFYKRLDLTQFPFPFEDGYFDKIICYSVVHYLPDHGQFQKLVCEMIRITKSGGKILIGDIPLSDKASRYLAERKKDKFRNFYFNIRYSLRKFITGLQYKLSGVDTGQVSGLAYTKPLVEKLISALGGIKFTFLEQDRLLPFANSREDLLISKS